MERDQSEGTRNYDKIKSHIRKIKEKLLIDCET